VKMARAEGSPTRAIFKLKDIDSLAAKYINRKKKHSTLTGIFQPGSTILDLGAAPGGWSKYAAERIKSKGILVAVDLLPLDARTVTAIERDSDAPIFHRIQGDFTTSHVKDEIVNLLSTNKPKKNGQRQSGVSFIISDMAPSFTGDKMTDALQTINLCEDTLMLAAGPSCFDERYIAGSDEREDGLLKRGGSFLCKYFACGQENEKDLKSAVKRHFNLSTVFKPKASRKESAELFLFATGYKGGK
jgi:23S rRNA (uridine2552-2'-O)-methyltransferase